LQNFKRIIIQLDFCIKLLFGDYQQKLKINFIEVLLRFIGCKKFVNKNILKFIKTKYILKDEYLSV
ncbi:hypothetical protein, partial [Leptospira interrogans]|uniref:hypothetical protein n=1 Tax=Leptospira interrogans TaxID=173 RepID=UPI000C1FA097